MLKAIKFGGSSVAGAEQFARVKAIVESDPARRLVVVSAGIRANIAIAQEAGLEVGRNVVVDDHMRTSAPDVYACGDCAVYGMSYGLWSEATEMGRVAGVNAAGGDEAYKPVARPLIFHGMGTALFALGDCGK